MLALMYGLLGEFSVDLLALRIGETVAGATVGIAVAYLVLPSRTKAAITDHARTLIEAVSALLGQAITHRLAPGTTVDEAVTSNKALLAAASALRADAQQLRAATRPLTHTPLTPAVLGSATRTDVRRHLRILLGCEHHARVIARICAIPPPPPHLPHPTLNAATDAVRHTLHTLTTAITTPTTTTTHLHQLRAAFTNSQHLLDRAEHGARHYPPPHRRQLLDLLEHLRSIDHAATELTHTLTKPNTHTPIDPTLTAHPSA